MKIDFMAARIPLRLHKILCLRTVVVGFLLASPFLLGCNSTSVVTHRSTGNSDYRTAFVTVGNDNMVVPVNLGSMKTMTPIKTGSAPIAIASSNSLSGKIVVGDYGISGSDNLPNTIEIIQWPKLTSSVFSLGSNHQPSAIAINDSGAIAYIATDYSRSLVKFSLSTDKIEASLDTHSNTHAIVIADKGRFAYLANYGAYGGRAGSSVIPVNLQSWKVDKPIYVGKEPCDEAVSPNGRYVFVTVESNSDMGGYVAEIDTRTNTVVRKVLVGPMPSGITISPDGANVWVALDPPNPRADAIVSFSLKSYKVSRPIFVGNDPWKIDIPSPSIAYVVDAGSGMLAKVNIAFHRVEKYIYVGSQPHGIVLLR